MYKRWLPFVLITILAVSVPAVQSAAASWSSFQLAEFTGIHISPALGSGTIDYTLRLNSDPNPPTITFGGATYDVNWIQAVYIVAGSQSTFKATEGDCPMEWAWDDKDNPGQIAGYRGTGSTRLYRGQTMSFSFDEFGPEPGEELDVMIGFHLGYQVDDIEYTGWFKGPTIPDDGSVPEPTSIAALMIPVAGLVLYRRKRRS